MNGVAPGLIATSFAGVLVDNVPDKRMVGQPDQIGAVVATICADKDGSFVNGSIFQVHGGFPKI